MEVSDNELKQPAASTVWTSDAAAAWVACALDCEGYIGVQKQAWVNADGGRSYSANVSVVNTDLRLLAFCAQLIDQDAGVGIKSTGVRSSPKHKTAYRLKLQMHKMVPVLKSVLPYLVLKQKQARLVIAFRHLMDQGMVTSQHEVFERIYQECKALNARGVQIG